jgi:hypothetical protein
MKFYGTLLSPKYIDVSYNDKQICFIDLKLILGSGSLKKWAEKCKLPPKLEYRAIYHLIDFVNLP